MDAIHLIHGIACIVGNNEVMNQRRYLTVQILAEFALFNIVLIAATQNIKYLIRTINFLTVLNDVKTFQRSYIGSGNFSCKDTAHCSRRRNE
jgi:energy-converting hydrogenase Eha subunit C